MTIIVIEGEQFASWNTSIFSSLIVHLTQNIAIHTEEDLHLM